MPLEPLVTAGIENPLNTFLYHSPALKTARLRLLGKVLRVEVRGLSTSLIPVFSEHQVDVLGEWAGDTDCAVTVYANVLPKLHDRQWLTALIHSGELEAQGDTWVMQNFVALVGLAEFDPAGLLAPHTGDITAEEISKAMRGDAKSLYHGIKRQQRHVAEAVTGEWHMTPGPFEVAWFAEETAAVKCTVGALTERLEGLEVK